MVIHWQRVGFVHGVMNTDNMSILGLTIDYGPYGWLEDYDKGWTPNTTDRQQKRYRYGHQPTIVHWNLYQLANALFVLIDDAPPLEKILNGLQETFLDAYLQMMGTKLGFEKTLDEETILIADLEDTLALTETDMTIFFRLLSHLTKEDTSATALQKLNAAFYQPKELTEEIEKKWHNWLSQYITKVSKESSSDQERAEKMNQVNPKYVLRNYMAQVAIDAAENGDYSIIEELYHLLQQPYAEQPDQQKWFAKRPEWARHKVGCSMLSCSS